MEHDSDVSATLAAAGFRRTPLEDDDRPDPAPEVNQRSTLSSIPSTGRISGYKLDELFNPYEEFQAAAPTPHHGHSHTPSGSHEPLLASFYQNNPQPPVPPPRNPMRLLDRNQESSALLEPAPDSTDDRLDPNIRTRTLIDLRDDEDYSRPVLGIRNLPDDKSLTSRE